MLENSGVAEPHNIRELFSEAAEAGHPLLSRVRLDTMVTVVDAHTFGGWPGSGPAPGICAMDLRTR